MAKKRGSSRSMSGRSSSRSSSGRSTSGRSTSGRSSSGRSTSGRSTSARSSAGKSTSGRSTSGRSRSGGSRVSSSGRSRSGGSATMAGRDISVSVAPARSKKNKTDQKMIFIAAGGVVVMIVFVVALWAMLPGSKKGKQLGPGANYQTGGLNQQTYNTSGGNYAGEEYDNARQIAPYGWDKVTVGMSMADVKKTVRGSYNTHQNPTVMEFGGGDLFSATGGPSSSTYRIYFDSSGKVKQLLTPQ